MEHMDSRSSRAAWSNGLPSQSSFLFAVPAIPEHCVGSVGNSCTQSNTEEREHLEKYLFISHDAALVNNRALTPIPQHKVFRA